MGDLCWEGEEENTWRWALVHADPPRGDLWKTDVPGMRFRLKERAGAERLSKDQQQ